MTERGRGALVQSPDRIQIGPSAMSWTADGLEISFNELSAPIPRRLMGRIRVEPRVTTARTFPLDAEGRHLWRPFAPRARVEVELSAPGLAWSGSGYFDSNQGEEPLERRFATWNWCRAHTAEDTFIFYDVVGADARPRDLALRLDPSGDFDEIAAPPAHALRSTFWRMPRTVRADAAPELRRTLEDAPFYARSELRGEVFGRPAEIVHESVSLARLRSPWVRGLLPFRMPRQVF